MGVSERDGRGGQTQKHRVGHGPCFARMTSGNVSGRANELADGMIRSLNATTEGENESISGSRLEGFLE